MWKKKPASGAETGFGRHFYQKIQKIIMNMISDFGLPGTFD